MSSDRSMPAVHTTRRYALDQIHDAAIALRSGSIVAFPTETVYGLGANAFDPAAIARVFQAKGRPQDNPLIVHVSDSQMLHRVANRVSVIAQRLIDSFWPGPLTLLFPKADEIPDSVTAGLDTVAVRMPSEPIALDLIRYAGVPIVAPSANLSGRPSATTWQAVAEDLDGRIDGIFCGPATRIGLESTVLDILHDPPRILRHGGISPESLRAALPRIVDACDPQDLPSDHAAPSPGMRHRHYQPKAAVRIRSASPSALEAGSGRGLRRGWIGMHPPPSDIDYAKVVLCRSVDEYAARLFETFREMDQIGMEVIDCESVPKDGIGIAIMDRLTRASAKS
ncbi:MAG: L-threonylcarbamoyladenylate synthase [Planctomycetota bacterium]|jgi:L-threonylcarbamoyladenylate synthase